MLNIYIVILPNGDSSVDCDWKVYNPIEGGARGRHNDKYKYK